MKSTVFWDLTAPGKTTTIKLILGFIFPDSGEISLLGKPASDVQVRSKIGYLPEISYYYWYLRAGELLNAYGKMFHLSAADRNKKIPQLLAKVGLPGHEKTFLREFSKGMLQRFSLAQALLNDPQFLILDEPASGLDPIGRKDIREIILELNQQGVTIFFSSHELSAVEMIAHRVGILNKGKMVAEGTLSELLSAVHKIQIVLHDKLSSGQQQDFIRRFESQYPAAKSRLAGIEDEGQSLFILDDREFIYPLMRMMDAEHYRIVAINTLRESLEELFMRIVKES